MSPETRRLLDLAGRAAFAGARSLWRLACWLAETGEKIEARQ